MEESLGRYNALQLAYLGDAVFELAVRSYLLQKYAQDVNALNKRAFAIVNASSQAKAVLKLEESLSEEERAFVKYGRNAKGGTSHRARMIDYRYATGLECLFGALYLKGQHERLRVLIEQAIAVTEE